MAALPLLLLMRLVQHADAMPAGSGTDLANKFAQEISSHVSSAPALRKKSGSATAQSSNTWDEPQLIHEVHDVPHLCSHTFCILREGGKIELYSKEGSAE